MTETEYREAIWRERLIASRYLKRRVNEIRRELGLDITNTAGLPSQTREEALWRNLILLRGINQALNRMGVQISRMGTQINQECDATWHEFCEDVNDASMCMCGVPALCHDSIGRSLS